MKREEKLKDNALNMKTEYQVNNRNITRKIDTIFSDEINHFKHLFANFNEVYQCIDESEKNNIIKQIESIFNKVKVILVDDYQARFEKNLEGLITTMYDFYLKKLYNAHAKTPAREIDKHLSELCKFESFIFEDKLEDALIDFSDNFIYRYINSDEAKKDFVHLMKNLNHSVVCELKKAIANSIQDKQEIVIRYNRLNKSVILQTETR